MNLEHYSSLLPEIFRQNTSRVRINQPQVILLDFHGTISERRWEEKVVFPYIKKATPNFIRENWRSDLVQEHLPSLQNESFEQRFRHKYEDAPVISNSEDVEDVEFANQISEFLLWQFNNKKETRNTQAIERLVWQDGFRRHKIYTPVFDDVLPCLKQWRDQFNCLIYIISSIDNETLTLLFENTDRGNLNQYVKGYLGSKNSGEKLMSETYKEFWERFRHTSLIENPRPVLFLTDSGQEAKAASQVAAFECMLVRRPGNKRIRTYYLSQFQTVDKFSDIEFV